MHNTESHETAPLSLEQVLYPFRDLGGPQSSNQQLACDPIFNRYSAFWLTGATLDATYAALEGMHILRPEQTRSFVRQEHSRLLSFLAERYHSISGRFRTDSSERTEGVFACHSAIHVMRSLCGKLGNQPLGIEAYRQTLSSMDLDLQGDPIDAIRDMIADCRYEGGLTDNPKSRLVPSLTALYTATRVLKNLFDGEWLTELWKLIDQRQSERFLLGCLQQQRVTGRQVAGFSIHPDTEELCVNTTHFGLKLFHTLEMPIDSAIRGEIKEFLLAVYCDGGFSSTLYEPRSLNATFFGFSALRRLIDSAAWQDFKAEHLSAIQRFLDSCARATNGGSQFASGERRFVENTLATRYRVQIRRVLGLQSDQQDGEVREFEFFLDQYSESVGGFRAYPEGRVVEVGPGGAEELERRLGQKDDEFLEYFRSRTSSFGWDSADRKIADLYWEIAQMEAGLETSPRDQDLEKRRAQAVAKLVAYQSKRADWIETQYEQEIEPSFRRAEEQLAAARNLLSKYEEPSV